MDIFLLFPIHLFKNVDKLYNHKIYLVEEPRYMTDFKYHKLKLAYHRATMKNYYEYLVKNGFKCEYIDYKNVNTSFYKKLSKKKITMYDPNDIKLQNKVQKLIPSINVITTLNFLVDSEVLNKNLTKFYSGKKYNHQNFYKWQRIRLNILIDKEDKPIGGKWSFDEENRKKLPKKENIPKILDLYDEKDETIKKKIKIINEAKEYINKNFKNNYGTLDHFIYPIDHEDSKKWLLFFLKNKFEKFGIYEDAVDDKDPFLFHSVLTPMMNIGLLTDREVLDETLKYYDRIPLNSFEGFIRQIIGWRNYIYAIYLLEANNNKIQELNFFNHHNKIRNDMLWKGTTEILPIDNIIKKINDYSYAHHIERLMYLGNYMLLCMVDPKDVYKIFMEWTIDAYDWVMFANVYCMSQYADGGLVMTKPYFSSSSYILRMSNYKKSSWCALWDALYYNFINIHEDYLSKNYGTARQVAHWKKKSPSEKKKLLLSAHEYLSKFFSTK
jgi:deoxyribodipyrimidine photolyase-related protein